MFLFLLKVDRHISTPETPFLNWCFANWYWLLLGCLLINIITCVGLYIDSRYPNFFALFDFDKKILYNDKIPTFLKKVLILIITFCFILPCFTLLLYVFGNFLWEIIKVAWCFAYMFFSAIWYSLVVPLLGVIITGGVIFLIILGYFVIREYMRK